MDTETKALMREIAKDAAKEAVSQTLVSLGIDTENPIEVQKDLASLRELRRIFGDGDMQSDLAHLRAWRIRMEKVEEKGVLMFVTIGIAAVLGMLWLGFRTKLGL